MSDEPSFTVAELAEFCGGRLVAAAERGSIVIRAVAAVDAAGPDAVTWISDKQHAKQLAASGAGAVIGTETLLGGDPRGIIVDDPLTAIAAVLDRFLIPPERPEPGIHATAVVHESANLGVGVAVGAHAVVHAEAKIGDHTVLHEGVSIGRAVRIGRDCELYDHCVIYDRCELGSNVVLHAGVVVGADGFGYIFRDGGHRKFAHLGNVVIEDEVEIGVNSCVDRAKVGTTRIGRGCKIDNLVQIAHNVQLGPLCVIAAQTGIAGSARIGAGVVMAGQTGVSEGLDIGDGVKVTAGSATFRSVPAGSVVTGTPARDHMSVLRDQARVRKLQSLFDEVAALKRRVAELESRNSKVER